MALVNRNAAAILEEKDLSGDTLRKLVEDLFHDPDTIPTLSANAKKMAITDANDRIYQLIREVLGRTKG